MVLIFVVVLLPLHPKFDLSVSVRVGCRFDNSAIAQTAKSEVTSDPPFLRAIAAISHLDVLAEIGGRFPRG